MERKKNNNQNKNFNSEVGGKPNSKSYSRVNPQPNWLQYIAYRDMRFVGKIKKNYVLGRLTVWLRGAT